MRLPVGPRKHYRASAESVGEIRDAASEIDGQ
jgi:hypothetical protein